MFKRRSMLALAVATLTAACGSGRHGFYELVPKRQFKITIEDGGRDALLQFVQSFANEHGFSIVREDYPSDPTAPGVFWLLERFEGMIVFQNKVLPEEPGLDRRLPRHSQTEFSAMFYRSTFGYDDAQIAQLIETFGEEFMATEGAREFVDAFPRPAQ